MSEVDRILWALLGDELEVAALPPPPRVPSFARETARPKPKADR